MESLIHLRTGNMFSVVLGMIKRFRVYADTTWLVLC